MRLDFFDEEATDDKKANQLSLKESQYHYEWQIQSTTCYRVEVMGEQNNSIQVFSNLL